MNRISSLLFSRSAALAAALASAVVLMFAAAPAAGDIPDHPDKLKYEELRYTPPAPGDYRHHLKCGATVYIAENHEVPVFQMTVAVRTGSMYEPLEKAGLAEMTGYMMRNGGIEGMTAKELDERLAFLAGDISVRIGPDRGSANLFCLVKDMDEGLDLLNRILTRPVFDPEAMERHRTDLLSNMGQRNNSTAGIESREWNFLLYGDHPCTNPMRTTEPSLKAVTREDLIAFHDKYFYPQNYVIGVSGDFAADEVLAKLDKMFGGASDREPQQPVVYDPVAEPAPGVYMIKKDDVNQSRIRVGHLGVKRDIPDEFALMVMNDILGGGGFTSRITRRVRSDEGLAYNTGSRFDRPVLYPGTFQAWFQTKHATAAFGTRLIVDEIERIRTEKCDEEIVENSKAGFIGNVVNPFSSVSGMINTFVDDDFDGRPDDYWRNYAKNMETVTPDDVLAVAQKYLHPDKLVFLVVGDPEAVELGSDKHEEKFSDFGKITILPMRDPMTLEAE